MAGANVFHVEFGFNDTELTSCIEQEKYAVAEQMIYDNAHTAYLDEGCYQRTALFIALCGRNACDTEFKKRNLHLAKVLVQSGASPNFRVPESDFGIYMGPGKTPLELVIDFFNSITNACTANPEKINSDLLREVTSVIGLDNRSITHYEDLLNQLCDLVFIILSHGGDANVLDQQRQTALHRTVAHSSSTVMIRVLCENGADINATNRHGDTPLMAAIQEAHGDLRHEIIDYLLNCPEIEINHANKLGRTALFHAMASGDVDTAEKLMKRNCDVTNTGKVWQLIDNTGHQISVSREVSPLFAAMCSKYAQIYLQETYCSGKSASATFFTAPFVDQGHFVSESIVTELKTFLQEDFPELLHLARLDNNLVNLIFGSTTLTLRQLAARKIFSFLVRKLLETTTAANVISTLPYPSRYLSDMDNDLCVKITYHEFDNIMSLNPQNAQANLASESQMPKTRKRSLHCIEEENETESENESEVSISTLLDMEMAKLQAVDISVMKLEELMDKSILPADCLTALEIELFRFKLFLLLQRCSLNKQGDENDWDYEDDSDVSEEDDSDLEYW